MVFLWIINIDDKNENKNFVKIDEPRTYFDVLCKQNSVSYWYKKKLSWQHLLVREEDELLDDKRTLPPSA